MSSIYNIRVEGHLDPSWSEWLEGMSIVPLPDGETLITGPVEDQPALHGLFNRIRNLNLRIISVEILQDHV